jgi:hypothetical protein
MSENLSGYKLPGGIRCPQCGTELIGASPVTGGKPRGFKDGTIIVCFHCSAIVRVTKTGLRPITDTEMNALDQNTKRVLTLAVQKIREI